MPTIQFFAALRQIAGAREIEMEAGTVKEALERLSTDYGGRLDRYLRISTVLINGKNVAQRKGRRTKLEPDDVVSIFPPLGGG
ncbi:MAG: molybdopterin synthase sulfur carrier subunit [Candidatus Anoxymicrobium japonicum]|uniref:Molybdopterin synthase sulfur carrier subunit n=1 Tax=Candidatus Anoxymicrobium japonicum TaxID=2013648 RepID=A0A2N3G6D1_9ACTN|nr:MAG: molybdopterin synthase sulfur carrier subunit [Candidatus Anoxymicrobium japonicum]